MTKPNSDGVCEMNRMCVRPTARGHGVGRALVGEIPNAARGLGYSRMILADGSRRTEALAWYRSLGFADDQSLPDTRAGDLEVRLILDV